MDYFIDFLGARTSIDDLEKLTKNHIVVDYEYGKNSNGKQIIINIGAIQYDGSKEIDRFESLSTPTSIDINSLNGIANKFNINKNDIVRDNQGYRNMFVEYYQWLQTSKLRNVRLVSYGEGADLNFLNNELLHFLGIDFTQKSRQMITYDIQKAWTTAFESQPMSLDSVSKFLNIKQKNKHQAVKDCGLINRVLIETYNLRKMMTQK